MDGIRAVSGVMTSAVGIHSSAKYFAGQIPPAYSIPFTFNVPATTQVGKPVYIWGTAPKGIVFIYSGDQLERNNIIPENNGHYGTYLSFGRVGEYVLTAVSNGSEKIERVINAT